MRKRDRRVERAILLEEWFTRSVRSPYGVGALVIGVSTVVLYRWILGPDHPAARWTLGVGVALTMLCIFKAPSREKPSPVLPNSAHVDRDVVIVTAMDQHTPNEQRIALQQSSSEPGSAPVQTPNRPGSR